MYSLAIVRSDGGALQVDPIAAEARALVFEHIDRTAEVRIGCCRDGVAGRLPLENCVAAKTGALG
jgi:hypothetical protein